MDGLRQRRGLRGQYAEQEEFKNRSPGGEQAGSYDVQHRAELLVLRPQRGGLLKFVMLRLDEGLVI